MKNMIDIESITKTKLKIEMYIREESIQIDSINSQFKNILSTMDLSSNSTLDGLQTEMSNKFKIIKRVHSNDEAVLIKNALKYEETADQVSRTFENIYKG